MTKEMKKAAEAHTELQPASAPTTPQNLYTKINNLNSTIDALLKSEPNDDERKRLEELKKLLTQTKEEIEQNASNPKLNKKMVALHPHLNRFLDGLKTDFDALLSDAGPDKGFMVANTLGKKCDLAKFIWAASAPIGYFTEYKKLPSTLKHSADSDGLMIAFFISSLGLDGLFIASTIVFVLLFLEPVLGGPGTGFAFAFLGVTLLTAVLIGTLSLYFGVLLIGLFARYDLNIRSLQKLALSFEKKSVYENFSALTARKISQALEQGKSPLLTQDFSETTHRMTTFVFAQNETALADVCEMLFKNRVNFLVTKNEGAQGGYVIGTTTDDRSIIINNPNVSKFPRVFISEPTLRYTIDAQFYTIDADFSPHFPSGVTFKVGSITIRSDSNEANTQASIECPVQQVPTAIATDIVTARAVTLAGSWCDNKQPSTSSAGP